MVEAGMLKERLPFTIDLGMRAALMVIKLAKHFEIGAVVAATLLFMSVAHADEQTRRVQEELRKRNLFFGNIDGQKTNETTAALRNYQQRKGFATTGELDTDTLNSLGVTTSAPLPDVPVLKSDIGAPAPQVSPDQGQGVAGAIPDSSAEPLVPSQSPEAVAEYIDEAPAGTKPIPPKQEEPVINFVKNYLRAVESNRPADELKFYADRVNYLHKGSVDKSVIRKNSSKYQKLWPQRNYALLDAESYSVRRVPGAIIVKFRTGYSLTNNRRNLHATGQTYNVMTLKITGDNLKIVALKEQRITGDTRLRRPSFSCRLTVSIGKLLGCRDL
jgi:peptidoglycan hydrolase-like protein with peptidoglycan-binding domain